MGINALLREDVNLFDTTNHKQNPQMMVNMSTTYVVKDVMEVLINKKLARTTLVHHLCVVLAYLHVISVLHADYNVEGIFKVRTFLIFLFIFDNILCWQCFIYYAAFTSLNFPYKLFLALRFFVRRDGRWHRLMKTVTLVHKLLCLGLNVYWQSFYLGRLWPVVRHSGVMTGELRLTDSLGVVLTLLSLSHSSHLHWTDGWLAAGGVHRSQTFAGQLKKQTRHFFCNILFTFFPREEKLLLKLPLVFLCFSGNINKDWRLPSCNSESLSSREMSSV